MKTITLIYTTIISILPKSFSIIILFHLFLKILLLLILQFWIILFSLINILEMTILMTLRMSCLSSLINKKLLSLNDSYGENGSQLSGGQAQRAS